MSVLAYSELLKRIAGIDDRKLDSSFQILQRNNTTKLRYKALKFLAESPQPLTVSLLLKKIGYPSSGGSYLTVRQYFRDLEREGLLEAEKIDSAITWRFSGKAQLLQKYLQA